MKYFFTADWHLGDDEIIDIEFRPFKKKEEMEELLIKDINSKCKEEDMLYVIGDILSYRPMIDVVIDIKDIERVIRRIKTKVVLIVGNNERRLIEDRYDNSIEKFRAECKKRGIETVREEDYISFGDKIFYINHFPSKAKDNYINLFGHVHKITGWNKRKGLNMSVDLNHFRVYSEEDILKLLDQKKRFWDDDKDVLAE